MNAAEPTPPSSPSWPPRRLLNRALTEHITWAAAIADPPTGQPGSLTTLIVQPPPPWGGCTAEGPAVPNRGDTAANGPYLTIAHPSPRTTPDQVGEPA